VWASLQEAALIAQWLAWPARSTTEHNIADIDRFRWNVGTCGFQNSLTAATLTMHILLYLVHITNMHRRQHPTGALALQRLVVMRDCM
jgi:hypothetical protein